MYIRVFSGVLWALKFIRFNIFGKFTQYLKINVFYTDRADARQCLIIGKWIHIWNVCNYVLSHRPSAASLHQPYCPAWLTIGFLMHYNLWPVITGCQWTCVRGWVLPVSQPSVYSLYCVQMLSQHQEAVLRVCLSLCVCWTYCGSTNWGKN